MYKSKKYINNNLNFFNIICITNKKNQYLQVKVIMNVHKK